MASALRNICKIKRILILEVEVGSACSQFESVEDVSSFCADSRKDKHNHVDRNPASG